MLSHHHKTIFVHIPKCAGQSVEMAFLNDLGLTWETRAPLLLRFNDRPEIGPPRLAHLKARDYVMYRYTTAEMFDAYFKFAIVRNPWSRTVSLYRHLNYNMPFKDFVSRWLADQFVNGEKADIYWFVRPQTDYVYDNGKLLVNDIVRFEALKDEFGRIVSATGLASGLPHVNKSRHHARQCSKPGNFASSLRHAAATVKSVLKANRRDEHDLWQKFYDVETAEIVKKLYIKETSEFGYTFDA